MTEIHTLTYADIETAARDLAHRNAVQSVGVHGVTQGGCVPATMVAHHLGVPLLDTPVPGCLVVDDLVDSGATASRFAGYAFDALYRKSWSPPDVAPGATLIDDNVWLSFPWETNHGSPTDAVVRLLEYIGEDPTRDGLVDTPARVVKAWQEMTDGYALDPEDILARQFDVYHDEMILLTDIPFVSLCEHHVLPFHGTASVGYVPNPDSGKVVGLSKLARLVDCYAHRLQVQERLTDQITEALVKHLDPLGAGVLIRAEHSCMSCRGIRKAGSQMVTSSLVGIFRENPDARSEFLALTRTSG